MESTDLIHFRARYGLSKAAAARLLGCPPRTYYNYEKGVSEIPKSIDFALSAIALGLMPYSQLKDLLIAKGKK